VWTHGRAAKVSEGGGAEVVEVVGGWVVELGFSPPLQWRGEGRGSGEQQKGRRRASSQGRELRAGPWVGLRTKQAGRKAGRESGEAKMPLYQGLNRKTAHQSVIFPSREIRGAARGQGSTVASVMEVW